MNYLKFIKKTKLILMGILIFLSSFNGVLLSGIIVYAGSLNQTSSFSDVLRFGAISISGLVSNLYIKLLFRSNGSINNERYKCKN